MNAQNRLAVGQDQLREFLGVLRRRRVWVGASLVIFLAIGIFMSARQDPAYASDAQVLVLPIRRSLETAIQTPINMDTERELAQSPAVIDLATSLGNFLDPGESLSKNLSVDVAPDTEIMIYTYEDTDPNEARIGAQAFADAYLSFRETQAEGDTAIASQPIIDRVEKLEKQLRNIDDKLKLSRAPGETPADVPDEIILKAQIEVIVNRIGDLDQDLADLDPELLRVGALVGEAQKPSAPSGSPYQTNVPFSLAAGLLTGIAVAFLRERFDERLLEQHDLESQIEATVLALIPRNHRWRRKQATLSVASEPYSAVSEAFGQLRTAVLVAAKRGNASTILVTSAVEGEGKTTTVANLSVALANAGKKVIAVSADLRRPRLHRYFRANDSKGLTSVLAGEKTVQQALESVGINNLRFLPTGPLPGNPSELLGSEAMRGIIGELSDSCDFVIIDSAPLLPVADALALATATDGVLFVADGKRSRVSAVGQARRRLKQAGVPIIGAVLSNFDPAKALRTNYYFSREYAFGDGEREPRTPRAGRSAKRSS